MTIYKACTSCSDKYFDFITYQNETSFVGILRTGKFKDHDLELRNCVCGSTLATEMPKLSRRDKQTLWEHSSYRHYKKKKVLYIADVAPKPRDCAKKSK